MVIRRRHIDHSGTETGAGAGAGEYATAVIKVLLLADTHLGFDLPVETAGGEEAARARFLRQHPARPGTGPSRPGGHRGPRRRSALPQQGPGMAGGAGTGTAARGGRQRRAGGAGAGQSRALCAAVPVVGEPRESARARSTENGGAGDRRGAIGGGWISVRARQHPGSVFDPGRRSVGCSACAADIRLLCLHQTVEGSRVKGYTFRSGDDIIRGRDIPAGLAAVLCGHIHRSQVLTRDLAGKRLAAPVLLPGLGRAHQPRRAGRTQGIPDPRARSRFRERWQARGLGVPRTARATDVCPHDRCHRSRT